MSDITSNILIKCLKARSIPDIIVSGANGEIVAFCGTGLSL
jgi:hypothetical protein